MRIKWIPALTCIFCFGVTSALAQQAPKSKPVDAPPIRAQLKAREFATLSTNIAGAINELPVREGVRVKKGERIALLDCSYQEAEKNMAAAKLDAATAKNDANKRLKELQSAGTLEVRLSQADATMAEAELAAINVTLAKCDIRAPFDGIITRQFVQAHQYVREGDPLVELTSNTNLEIETIVPSVWLTWLHEGTPFTIDVYETRQTLDARIDRVGGRVDPLSQTVRIIGAFVNQPDNLLPGMSGTLAFPNKNAAR